MTYYDRLVQDPTATQAEIASRRNLSPEQLAARVASIRTAAESGEHLTLGQVKSLCDSSSAASAELLAHVDRCPYCQALLEGLNPDRVQRMWENLAESLPAQVPTETVSPPASGASVANVGDRRLAAWMPVATAITGLAVGVPLAPYLPWMKHEVWHANVMVPNGRVELDNEHDQLATLAANSDRPPVLLLTSDHSATSKLAGHSMQVVPLSACYSGTDASFDERRTVANHAFTVSISAKETAEWTVEKSGPNLELKPATGGKTESSSRLWKPGDNVVVLSGR